MYVSILSFKFLFTPSQPRLLRPSLSLRLKAAGKLAVNQRRETLASRLWCGCSCSAWLLVVDELCGLNLDWKNFKNLIAIVFNVSNNRLVSENLNSSTPGVVVLLIHSVHCIKNKFKRSC